MILYLGVLYHTMYPFEHLRRLASASTDGTTLLIETEFYNLPGFEDAATIFYDYRQNLTSDPTSPVFPSLSWISITLERSGFDEVTLLSGANDQHRGRATLRAEYDGKPRSPFFYASEQIGEDTSQSASEIIP